MTPSNCIILGRRRSLSFTW